MKSQTIILLESAEEYIYKPCHLLMNSIQWHPESIEYGACTYMLNKLNIEHRVSKITPTKTGQFVTIWKRNEEGVTTPLDSSDSFNFLIITSTNNEHIGQFIFPKSVLIDKGIISENNKGGKRGIRVYPPWDITNSKQAIKTQQWQLQYFVIVSDKFNDVNLIKKLFNI